MPQKIHDLFDNVARSYGSPEFRCSMGFVNNLQHRCSDVLAMYPIKLNNVEERFGSWMVQYGYCSYITEEKLLENAQVTDHGTIRVKDKEYRCLLVLFEPFLNKKTFELIETLLARGGKVLWMSVPALADADGGDEAERFKKIFGLETICDGCFSEHHKGESVQFGGRLAGMEEMPILTDFLVDAVYPCTPAADADAVACIAGKPVAVCKNYPNSGAALYAGFRVRDDQSCSLGKDVDTLFRMLCAIDAYRPGSLEVRSRRSDSAYVMNTFVNGSVSCAPHYRGVYEAWEGTFFRDEDYDKAILEGREIPDGRIELDEDIQGRHITFHGKDKLSYRLDEAGVPVAFSGMDTDGITIDGVKYTYADRKADFEFAPVDAKFLADGVQNAVSVYCGTEGSVLTIPVAAKTAPRALGCKDYVFGAEIPVESSFADGKLTFTVTPELAGHYVMLTF